jgi:hypothetical protein
VLSLADHTIDINLNDNSSKGSLGNLGGRATRSSSAIDDASVNRISKALKSGLEGLSKKQAKDFADALFPILRRALGAGTGASSGISDSDIRTIAKMFGINMAKAYIDQVAKSASKPSGGAAAGISQRDIENSINRAAQKVAETLAGKLKGTAGVSLDAKGLGQTIAAEIIKIIPRDTDRATRELLTAVNSLKTMIRSFDTVLGSIKSMRISGGKVDTSEISSVVSQLIGAFKIMRELAEEAKKAKDSLGQLSKEAKTSFNAVGDAIDEIKKSAERKVGTLRRDAAEDPQRFTKEVVLAIRAALSKSEKTKDTKLYKALESLEGKIGDIGSLSKELRTFGNILREQARGGKISIEGADTLLREFKRVSESVGSAMPAFDIKGKVPKEWAELFKAFKEFKKELEELDAEVKLIFNDKDLQKKLPKSATLQIIPEVDTKRIKDQVPDSVPMDVEPKVSDVGIKKIRKKVKDVGKEKIEFNNADIRIAYDAKDIGKLKNILADAEARAADSSGRSFTRRIKKVTKLIEDLEKKAAIELKIAIDDSQAKAQLNELRKNLDKFRDQSVGPARRRAAKIDFDAGAYNLYKPRTIDPAAKGSKYLEDSNFKPSSRGYVRGEAQKIQIQTTNSIKQLSMSLDKLQKSLVDNLDKAFKKAGNDWEVLKSPTAKNNAFNLAPGGRQWVAQIADVGRLRRQFNDRDSSAASLVARYKREIISERIQAAPSPSKQAELIAKWLSSAPDARVSALAGKDGGLSTEMVATLKALKKQTTGPDVSQELVKTVEKTLARDIQNVFEKTFARQAAENRIQSEKIVRSIALPAAQVSARGDVSFQTIHGSQRALPKFAEFRTGFEKLYEEFYKLDKPQVARGFSERIKEVGVRPTPAQMQDANNLAREMLSAMSSAGKKGLEEVKSYYAGTFSKELGRRVPSKDEQGRLKPTAIQFKSRELYDAKVIKSIKSIDAFESKLNDTVAAFDKLDKSQQTVDKFIDMMDKAGVSAYDAVKSLTELKQVDVYAFLNKVLKGNDKVSPITQLAENPQYDKMIREFEASVRHVEGLLPIIEANKPRRARHQERMVNLITRPTDIHRGYDDRLTPEQQKSLIKDINLTLDELATRMEQITGKPSIRLSSLGIPEAQAGDVTEYRSKERGGSRYLNTLESTVLKFSAEDLTAQAPFKQFQQVGRNISNVTNALDNAAGKMAGAIETPKLRSEYERALIQSSRVGQTGYGYNAVTELRATASTFEDQIVIAGKLAKALTSATKTLVKPAPSGRLESATMEDRITGAGVSKINEGDLKKVNDVIMNILGIEDKYKGRADERLIEEVKNTIAVVRGESVEVQQAKLAETYLNYFGRKFTTRYGSKGVSITPTGGGNIQNIHQALSQHTGAQIKVDPSATLGYQVVQKSMGELMSELIEKYKERLIKSGTFDDKSLKQLQDELVSSGNKFIIDLFHAKSRGGLGILAPDEVKKVGETYDKFSMAWKQIFDKAVPKPGIKGIEGIKTGYQQRIGNDLTTARPIEMRISSYGAAKRGLQTEFMEVMMNNLIGAGDKGKTTLKQLSPEAYKRLLGGEGQMGAFAEYGAALGYTGSGKEKEEIAKALFKRAGGKGDYLSALQIVDDSDDNKKKALMAQRAAALEAASRYYSTVIDEFGKARKGLVGEKFVQIIEEPHETAEWTKGQVFGGEKGAKLNIPAFAAYASVFGEQSAMIKEIQQSLDVNSKKHWEYLKALQAVNKEDAMMWDAVTKGLETVDISRFDPFEGSTGTYGKKYTINELGEKVANPRSFEDTILDIQKYPQAFKLAIPTGRYDKEGRPEREDFYVPGATARGTYDEPLVAGEYGLDQMSRRLVHVANMAKELEMAMENIDSVVDSSRAKSKVIAIVNTWAKEVADLSKKKDAESEEAIKSYINRLTPGLSTTEPVAPALARNAGGRTEFKYAQDTLNDQLAKYSAGEKTIQEAYATSFNVMADLIKGKQNPDDELQALAPNALTRAEASGSVGSFAKSIGIDVQQDEINKKIENLQKAKIDYYNSLAETALGKTGSVAETFFSRKIPAVIGKAVVATTDKRIELKAFTKKLEILEQKYGESFLDQKEALSDIYSKHKSAVLDYEKNAGLPVLRQEEIGVSEKFASKIPTEFLSASIEDDSLKIGEAVQGTLLDIFKLKEELEKAAKKSGNANLEKEVKEFIENQLVPYIESIRYPFTGTSSIAPFKPKLIKESDYKGVDKRGLAGQALIVPGVPEGFEGLKDVVDNLQAGIEDLRAKREKAQKADAPEAEIKRMTSLIRELNAAIDQVIPKYTAQAQKLDFDGDQIEIHSAKTIEARRNIAEHFKSFHRPSEGRDITTAELYRRKFLSDAVVQSSGEFVIGESALAAEKKFPKGKGFDFLQSPFLTKELEYLTGSQALATLGDLPEVGYLENVIKDVLVQRAPDQVESVMKALATIPKDENMSNENYATAIMDMIDTRFKHLNEIVEAGVKKRLYEEKYGAAIEANLFKIHTISEACKPEQKSAAGSGAVVGASHDPIRNQRAAHFSSIGRSLSESESQTTRRGRSRVAVETKERIDQYSNAV